MMFAALGFLAASLLWLLAAPGFWARAVRLTSERLRESMPLTEAEIRADKDRMRAEYALKIHHQQVELDEIKLAAARQLIELNRRDARINGLETDIEAVAASLEGALNARGVLEQTVADRLPRLEVRLEEAKSHLSGRDKEIADLTRSAERQTRALQEAGAINEQLSREVRSLMTALETAGAKTAAGSADSGDDAVVAMRAELDALRTRSREQGALIDRLQKAITETAAVPLRETGKPIPLRADAAAGNAADQSEKKLREIRALAATQEQEIARLKTAAAIQERAGKGSIGDSRIALKAGLEALEEKAGGQEATINALRSEVAALQEQLTQQAGEHAAAVSRLGGGTQPLSDGASTPRERRAIPRLTLAERVAQTRREVEDEEKAGPAEAPEPSAAPAVETPAATAAMVEGDPAAANVSAEAATTDVAKEGGAERRPPRIKSRLLDRISDLSKAKA
jgi:chromosome segregation ATPase